MKKKNMYRFINLIIIYIIAAAISFLFIKNVNISGLSKVFTAVAMSFLLWVIIYCCMEFFNYGKNHVKKRTLSLLFLYILNVIAATIIFFILTGNNALYGDYGQLIVLCAGEFFCLYGGVCAIRLQRVFENEEQINDNLKEIYIKIDELHRDYSKIMSVKESIGYMRHDIANHIAVVESVLPKDSREVNALIDIKNYIQKTEEIKYCNNRMLEIAFEKKIKQLEEKGLNVDTDIRIENIEGLQCEKICLLMWMLIDNVGNYMRQNEKITIKVFERNMQTKYTAISFLVRGYSKKINKHTLKTGGEMKMIEYLIDSMDGSIVIDDDEAGVAEAGMVEVEQIYE